MMAIDRLGAPPVLSTPDTHTLGDRVSAVGSSSTRVSDEEFYTRYEIQRTLDEIRSHSWRKVALQFPDEMLLDSARVFQLLARGIRDESYGCKEFRGDRADTPNPGEDLSDKVSGPGIEDDERLAKLTILADTSYGSCCVDEIAAEHVEADVVVHYGRACLSPTARLPVLHVFTRQSLHSEEVLEAFRNAFPDRSMKIVLTADTAYAHHINTIYQELLKEEYKEVFAADIIHDPASPIPNRTVPEEVQENPENLKDWRLFHIAEPSTSLLLTLSSRLSEIYVYPTSDKGHKSVTPSLVTDTSLLLRRRYGLVISLATVSIWGILINTLSVKNYLHIVDHVKSQIAAAGKKSYMFVVGKLNAAKLANFSEVGGWVVIGCWESSLVDSKDFYTPVITPFELELALRRDEERVWTGEWHADFQLILDGTHSNEAHQTTGKLQDELDGYDSEQESTPPEFDLRTGRYVSQTRPIQAASKDRIELPNSNDTPHSSALIRRANGGVVAVNGVASPAAQFLQSKKTWKGLGSDFEIGYEAERKTEGSTIQEGRSGIARGYLVGARDSKT